MSDPSFSNSFDDCILKLEGSGDYRVLRRVVPREEFNVATSEPSKIGVVLDIETTGLDADRDEIIELGMIKFEYSVDGRILKVVDNFEASQEPSIPIPPNIQRLTGITPESVKGKAIDKLRVSQFIENAVLIVAHNAGFDRPICERFIPAFSDKAWACSMSEVDWITAGFEGRSLHSILSAYRLFHDGHRAIEDCRALLEVLSRALRVTGKPVFRELLEAARSTTVISQ